MRFRSTIVKGKMLYCSFCRKSNEQLKKLVRRARRLYLRRLRRAMRSHPRWQTGSSVPGLDALKTDDLLKSLLPAANQLRKTEDVLRNHVATLRKREVTWTRIGEALGVSRQAAWERFSQEE